MNAERRVRSEATRLGGAERLSVLARSFLIQSVWNTRGMQNVGFCYAMLPVLRRLEAGSTPVRDYLKRHLQTFNTNPVLSCYALGAAARAELAGRGDEAADVKRALAGPLGMAGDALMWWSLRPLATFLAAAFALSGRVWAPLVLLGVYNVPHVILRARGISAGAERGVAGAKEVLGDGYRRVVTVVRASGAFVAGLVAALAASGGGGPEPRRLAVVFAVFVLAVLALRLRVPLTLIGIGGAAGGVALMLIGSS